MVDTDTKKEWAWKSKDGKTLKEFETNEKTKKP
jgi:hypothetical protein